MITFTAETPLGPCTFRMRAAAVIARPGQVLLHRCVVDDFWSVPGGRCEQMEPSDRCVEREIAEELRVQVTAERLLWLAESFYQEGGCSFHEVCFYYLVTAPPDSPLMLEDGPFAGFEGRLPLEFRWFALDSLPDLTIYPPLLRTRLATVSSSIPPYPEHIIEGLDIRIQEPA